MNLGESYKSLYNSVLRRLASDLEKYIASLFEETERIDAISARAKSPDRFIGKAQKLDSNGMLKYDDPLNQIQDQIGARITVFYLSDVDICRRTIERYFSFIEKQSKQPERQAEFGYFGEHMILNIPDDVTPDEYNGPKFFELQIKTLFQHAWSEAHHDLGYKAPRKLTALEERQVAFSAAQAWGADQIFLQLNASILTSANDDDTLEQLS